VCLGRLTPAPSWTERLLNALKHGLNSRRWQGGFLVLAGLREMRLLLEDLPRWAATSRLQAQLPASLLTDLETKGREALRAILPYECVHPPQHFRRFDAALLFLIYPLETVDFLDPLADSILSNVATNLQGEHGIRRYLGDSYWFPDYTTKLAPQERTKDSSQSTLWRDKHLPLGEEAQWCIFDPILSVIHGKRFLANRRRGDQAKAAESLRLQTLYLNRALGQLTAATEAKPAFLAPEAYYLCRGRYVPNDNTPLLWSQANLWLAVHEMCNTAWITDQAG
jgi:hypothetical protein